MKEQSVLPDAEGVANCSVCAVYEIRYNASIGTPQDLISILTPVAKKWCFQLEKGDSGYLHYQGRISLIKRRRKHEALQLFEEGEAPNFFEPTVSKEHTKCAFYCLKKDTRQNGPWTDEDPDPPCITRQVMEINKLYPFQQTIVDDAKVWNKRNINIVYCKDGNKGKTSLVQYCRAYKIGRPLPPVNDYKDLLRIVYCVPVSTMYLIDMPRSLNKDRLYQFFSAIETIKDGYAYDDRNRFREKTFNCPNIWIFSNTLPDLSMLSTDRWRLWNINAFKQLVPHIETCKIEGNGDTSISSQEAKPSKRISVEGLAPEPGQGTIPDYLNTL